MSVSGTRRARPRRPFAAAGAAVVLTLAPIPVAADRPPWPVMRSPLGGAVTVTAPFDPPAQPWLPGHRGVDLEGRSGGPVHSPADGTVLFAGPVDGRPVLSLAHGGGLRTTYEPVRAAVRAGDTVRAGDPVGHLLSGHPGCPVAACLHWGAIVGSGGPDGDDDEVYINPLTLLDHADRPIRLKPVRPGDGAV